MTEDKFQLFVERQRMIGLNEIRKHSARIAASLGLSSYEAWMRRSEFEQELTHFRARWMVGMSVLRPSASRIVGSVVP